MEGEIKREREKERERGRKTSKWLIQIPLHGVLLLNAHNTSATIGQLLTYEEARDELRISEHSLNLVLHSAVLPSTLLRIPCDDPLRRSIRRFISLHSSPSCDASLKQEESDPRKEEVTQVENFDDCPIGSLQRSIQTPAYSLSSASIASPLRLETPFATTLRSAPSLSSLPPSHSPAPSTSPSPPSDSLLFVTLTTVGGCHTITVESGKILSYLFHLLQKRLSPLSVEWIGSVEEGEGGVEERESLPGIACGGFRVYMERTPQVFFGWKMTWQYGDDVVATRAREEVSALSSLIQR